MFSTFGANGSELCVWLTVAASPLQTTWWPSAKRANSCRRRWRPRCTTYRTCELPPLSAPLASLASRHTLTRANHFTIGLQSHSARCAPKVLFNWHVSQLVLAKRPSESSGRLDVISYRIIASRFLFVTSKSSVCYESTAMCNFYITSTNY